MSLLLSCLYGLSVLGAASLSLFALTALVYRIRPNIIVSSYFRMAVYRSGLGIRYAQVEDLLLCYAERGQKVIGRPSIVLVHGFTASKDMWPVIVKRLPSNIHVLVVDLPGHGWSEAPAITADIHLHTFASILRQWITHIGLRDQPFHLVGGSLGGTISLLYAANYPEDVDRLTVICPAIRTPIETDFMRDVRTGSKCRLLPDTPDEVGQMLMDCSYNKQVLPKQILKGLLMLRQPKMPFFRRLYEEIRTLDSGEEGRELERRAHFVQAPTQIIWGEDDMLVHVSGAEQLKSMLPHCVRVDILQRCGHVCVLDRPTKVTNFILDFHLQDLPVEKKLK